MTSPDERASGGDRDAAIKVVEDALRSGRIIQADRDKRVDELKSAQTKQDIDMQVRDLLPHPASMAPQTPIPVAAAGVPGTTEPPYAGGQQPWPLVNYGPHAGSAVDLSSVVGKTGRRIGGIIAAVVLLSVVIPIAGTIIALVSARNTFDGVFGDPTDETTYLPGQDPGKGGINVHTAAGYQDMVDAVEEKTGSTMVFDVVMYPRYAVMEIPITEGSTRYQYFYWDGELAAETSKGVSSNTPIDLNDIKPELMIRLLEKARSLVDEPTSWYAYASNNTGTPQISAYASNEFSESEYVVATFDGKIVYDSSTS